MPTVPYVGNTWVDGSSLASAARLTVIENGIKEVSYAPAVRVTHNTTQAITSGTLTALAFNTERFDQAGNAADTMHDTVTNNSRLTCRYAGVYQISGCIEWASALGTGFRDIRIRLNGSTVIGWEQRAASTSSANNQFLTTLYALAVNDYVELCVAQTQGASVNVNNSGNYSPEFMMVRVA